MTVTDLHEHLGGQLIGNPAWGDKLVEHLLIGAMGVDAALSHFRRRTNKAVFTGGDDNKNSKANTTQTTAGQAKVLGQLPLKGVGKYAKSAEGVAVIAQRGNTPQLIMQAKLPPSKTRQAYEVWLYNSPTDAVSLGASTANKQGQFQGQGQLPANWRRYKFVDVSLETIDSNLKHSGNSVLRGALADLQAPPQGASTTPGATTTPTTPAP